jgi:hypothetical protein
MRKTLQLLIALGIFSGLTARAGLALAGQPDAVKFPNLVKSWEALQQARTHLQRAEEAHAKHGTLGGHAARAVEAVNVAQAEIDLAVDFAEKHRRPGAPGAVTPKPPLVARPDDAKYPNLGDARLEMEWAVRHIEDAMQFHLPIGTLGGHGEKAVAALRRGLQELNEAERWADTHH